MITAGSELVGQVVEQGAVTRGIGTTQQRHGEHLLLGGRMALSSGARLVGDGVIGGGQVGIEDNRASIMFDNVAPAEECFAVFVNGLCRGLATIEEFLVCF